MAGDNRTLGRFHLMGIPPAPRGVPQIEVTFDIDANGILHVSAKDRGTGTEQKIQITSSSGLNEDEINRMVDEAQTHATDDAAKRQEIETRNKLDGLVYSTEKLLDDNKVKLSDGDTAPVRAAIEESRAALEGTDPAAMEAAYERLTQASHQLAATLYQASTDAGETAGGGPSDPSGGAAASDDEEVIDAEYVDVNADEAK